MAWVPKFKLFASNGSTLIYTFPYVNFTNAPQSTEEYVEHQNIRAKGSLIIKGGKKAWDLILRFTLLTEDYQSLMALITNLEDTVLFNTPYVLKIEKAPNDYLIYNVKRLVAFEYEDNIRTNFTEVTANFRAYSW